MPGPAELFRWWIRDPRNGTRRLTTSHLTRENAQRRFPGAEPELASREFRPLRGGDESGGDTLPPDAP